MLAHDRRDVAEREAVGAERRHRAEASRVVERAPVALEGGRAVGRDHRTPTGRRPVEEFLDALPRRGRPHQRAAASTEPLEALERASGVAKAYRPPGGLPEGRHADFEEL